MGSPLGLTDTIKPTQTVSKFSNGGINTGSTTNVNYFPKNSDFYIPTGNGNSAYVESFPLGNANAVDGGNFGDQGHIYNSRYNKVDNMNYVSQDDPDDNVQDPGYTGDYNSIFNESKWYYRPKFSLLGVGESTSTTVEQHTENQSDADLLWEAKGRSSKRHKPDMYDISTNSIIDYTNDPLKPSLKLDPAHFAYLKNFGVYPNNRLVVSRRFPSPVDNDLTSSKLVPLSTIVSWMPDGENNFFSFETGEKWDVHTTTTPIKDLSDMFNKVIGKALPTTPGKEVTGGVGAMFKALPIGGVAEALELTIVNYLLGDGDKPASNFSYDNLHRGNPNFMGESAYRNMNSITSKISIPVKVTYEMKYINGLDPTIVFMDVIQNVLRFSSSQSVFFMSQAGGSNINKFIKNYKEGKWVDSIKIILDAIIHSVTKLVDGIKDIVTNTVEIIKNLDKEKAKNEIRRALSVIARSSLSRYRIEFNRIIPSMTGVSSAPWHITIGNPKNPFFSSGDMIVEGGKVTFGNILGFNDIPTRIDFEFTIRSARNLGIQEIFDKFNIGAGRQYQRDAIKFKVDWNQGRIKDQFVGEPPTDSEVYNDMLANEEAINSTDLLFGTDEESSSSLNPEFYNPDGSLKGSVDDQINNATQYNSLNTGKPIDISDEEFQKEISRLNRLGANK
tara:strand:+ start:16138 stop:18150 length:2013 start_codon:yes stop_codon:yes gene_type:complete